jgi:hypothetical protein
VHTLRVLSGLAELHGVRMLWFGDYYDGPVSGMAAYDGHECWFAAVWDERAGNWTDRPRLYVLHQLTDEQRAAEWDRHRSFAARVGGPGVGCLHEPPCPSRPLTSEEERRRWYKEWPPEQQPDHLDAPVIGWFAGT